MMAAQPFRSKPGMQFRTRQDCSENQMGVAVGLGDHVGEPVGRDFRIRIGIGYPQFAGTVRRGQGGMRTSTPS
jgi:hypothetical protein